MHGRTDVVQGGPRPARTCAKFRNTEKEIVDAEAERAGQIRELEEVEVDFATVAARANGDAEQTPNAAPISGKVDVRLSPHAQHLVPGPNDKGRQPAYRARFRSHLDRAAIDPGPVAVPLPWPL